MGMVYAEITLKNAGDIARSRIIPDTEIRQTMVQALVDAGAGTLVINEELRQQLGLEVRGERQVTMANKTMETCKFTEPVEIHWKNRLTAVPALVLADTDEVLLGAIHLEDLDLIVDPVWRELTGAHGDEVVCIVK